MARAVEQIERDIAALEDAVSALAAEISSAYTIYLTAPITVRQHLILASYHPCTQGYAKPFLSLSSTSGNNCSMPFVSWATDTDLFAYTKTEEKDTLSPLALWSWLSRNRTWNR